MGRIRALGVAAMAAALGLYGVAAGGTGACCAHDGSACVVTDVPGCPLPSVYLPGLTCTASVCMTMMGACCAADGVCTLTAASGCGGGSYAGEGTVCASVPCPEPKGACCGSASWCTQLVQSDCLALGATYYGDGKTCGPGATCPLGACCLPSGACTAGVTDGQCSMWQGAYRGVGSACATANCPQPSGACCSGPSCGQLPLAWCNVFGGTWLGPQTACGPSACAGVCCRGATCAANVAPSQCVPPQPGVGAWYAGAGACGSSSLQPCCVADFNKAGGVEILDIFDFLNAWFAGSPWASTGSAGAAAPTITDIFTFLAAWFYGC